jgi:hypothetical protein
VLDAKLGLGAPFVGSSNVRFEDLDEVRSGARSLESPARWRMTFAPRSIKSVTASR